MVTAKDARQAYATVQARKRAPHRDESQPHCTCEAVWRPMHTHVPLHDETVYVCERFRRFFLFFFWCSSSLDTGWTPVQLFVFVRMCDATTSPALSPTHAPPPPLALHSTLTLFRAKESRHDEGLVEEKREVDIARTQMR